jgi:hypothetical protein
MLKLLKSKNNLKNLKFFCTNNQPKMQQDNTNRKIKIKSFSCKGH